MSDCECNHNYGGIAFAISMLTSTIVILNWSNHQPPATPEQIQANSMFWNHISNLVNNFVTHYSTHPTDLLFKGWFWGIVGICLLPFSPLIIWGISDIVSFFKKDKPKPNNPFKKSSWTKSQDRHQEKEE